MSTLDVGPGLAYTTLSSAVAASAAGDTILVQAGTYENDFSDITHALTIDGVGGMASFVATTQPANGKGILVADADLTIDHMEFSGVTVPDGNGAGIRYDSGNLTITNSWFHDNQDGLLANADPTATISIASSEFDHNGSGDGYTHNIYIGEVGTLDITGSYFHDAAVGHEIKSRALVTNITDTRIEDGPTANTSYSVDLPDGGQDTLSDDVIEKGPNSENEYLVHFGGENSPSYAGSSLTVTGSTIVDDRSGSIAFLLNQSSTPLGLPIEANAVDDTVYGMNATQFLNGTLGLVGDVFPGGADPVLDTSDPFSLQTACYAAGTRIATPGGARPVETLRAGMQVLTAGGRVAALRWVGHRAVDPRRHRRPHDVAAIRILPDAFGPGRPHRMLRLSPDHAVFEGGVLIPIRYLVNGATVVQERPAPVVYWHVELARHDLLLAEGLAAESYLDTGNRGGFTGVPAGSAAAALRTWARLGCAPLCLGGARLVAARRRLLARAIALGHRVTGAAEPLVGAGSRRLRPEPVGGGRWRVALPPDAGAVRLLSRSAAPDWTDPASADRRMLGVAVAGMWLDGCRLELDDARLGQGWHPPEGGWRWTDGDAELASGGARSLVVETVLSGGYWLAPSSDATAATSPAARNGLRSTEKLSSSAATSP